MGSFSPTILVGPYYGLSEVIERRSQALNRLFERHADPEANGGQGGLFRFGVWLDDGIDGVKQLAVQFKRLGFVLYHVVSVGSWDVSAVLVVP